MNREGIQREALHVALKHKRSGLAISMGVGKTRIAIQHMQKHFTAFLEVLVVVPTNTIKEAWLRELTKMDMDKLVKHITFTNYRSINKHKPTEFDIVYLDECHSLKSTHEPFLKSYTGKILGLTGTPPRYEKSEKAILVQRYCPIKYEFDIDSATDSNILNNYKIFVHQLELSQKPTLKKKKKDGSFWYTSEAKDYNYCTNRISSAKVGSKEMQFAAIMRMRALMDYPTKEAYVKSILKRISTKCIVFANTQKQADLLCKHSYHTGNSNSDDNLELFSDGRINQLSCVLQLSEGVSIPDLKSGIIMHAYGNEKKTAQRIGRLLRLNPSEVATCHILCYNKTKDTQWVASALRSFDQSKIKYYNPLNK